MTNDSGRSPDGSGSRPSDQVRLRGLCHTASIPNACKAAPEGWWCSREAGHEGPCAARETVPPWYAKLVKELRDPPYWSAEYGPDDACLNIAPLHASDALEITLTALQAIKRVALACEGTPYDLILSYVEHALQARPANGFWVSGASTAAPTPMTNTPSPTDEDRELIRKLRADACMWDNTYAPLYAPAADRLESLLSDRAKLEEENAALIHDLERSMDTANQYVNENARLEERVRSLG